MRKNIIRERRNELGLTLRELGNLSGITFNQIFLLEHNKIKEPTISTMNAIGRALKLSPIEIAKYYGLEEF